MKNIVSYLSTKIPSSCSAIILGDLYPLYDVSVKHTGNPAFDTTSYKLCCIFSSMKPTTPQCTGSRQEYLTRSPRRDDAKEQKFGREDGTIQQNFNCVQRFSRRQKMTTKG